MFDHLLESSHWDDSNKWSSIGFGEETGIIELKIRSLYGALTFIDENERRIVEQVWSCMFPYVKRNKKYSRAIPIYSIFLPFVKVIVQLEDFMKSNGLKMYNNLFIFLDYVNCAVAKKPITTHPGNIEHSQTIMSLMTDLPYYEIKSPQNLKNTVIWLDKTKSWTLRKLTTERKKTTE